MRRVIGIGHSAGGDDRVGLRVVDLLRDCDGFAVCTVSDPLELMMALEGASEVVIVDALVGATSPVQWLERGDLVEERLLSSHGMSLLRALDMAACLMAELPSIRILGIGIERPAGYAMCLSLAAEQAAFQAADLLRRQFA